MRLVSHNQARRRLATGDRVADHLIIRSVLGKGGTATVFEALHERLGSLVALKVMDVEPQYARDAAARLEREAQVCAAIDDAHIPKIYDVGELDDGTPFIVMEKVSGRTLDDLLEDGPLRAPVALSIARELMDALAAVHRVGFVHRDVKPANVIVQATEEGAYRLRLMDFGVSKGISRSQRISNPAITHEGMLVGTPHYMAPEQMSDEGLDERTDVYAAGVLLYELLTGRVPFDGKSTAEVMSAVMRHSHTPISTWCPAASPGLTRLVERAMAQRPADRFASAREMRDAIDAEIKALRAPVAQRRSKRKSAFASLGAILLAGVLALVSRQLTQPRAANAKQAHAVESQHDLTKATQQTSLPVLTPPAFTMLPTIIASDPPAAPLQTSMAPAASSTASHMPAPLASPSRRSRPQSAPEPTRLTAQGPATVVAHGVLISDYVEQLQELERVVSTVAESLEGPGPLPPNPYR